MSNMLYACSILYKTRLPFILAFNKTDLESHEFAVEWMRDFEEFQKALLERRKTHGEDVDGPAYMDSLMNSMSLVLDEFYKHLRVSLPLSPFSLTRCSLIDPDLFPSRSRPSEFRQ
jgi:GTPase SAR1 family protein